MAEIRVGILGAGHMGQGLAAAWAAAGHAVTLGSRNPSGLRVAGTAGLRAGTYEAAATEPVVVLATPFGATADLVRRHAAVLAGKILIDITNPFGAAPAGTAGVAVHAAALGAPARWVAAFKTNFWSTIAAVDGQERQCLIAADDARARETAGALAAAAGYSPLHCGGLDGALVLDSMVPLMIALDGRLGGHHRSHWQFVTGEE